MPPHAQSCSGRDGLIEHLGWRRICERGIGLRLGEVQQQPLPAMRLHHQRPAKIGCCAPRLIRGPSDDVLTDVGIVREPSGPGRNPRVRGGRLVQFGEMLYEGT